MLPRLICASEGNHGLSVAAAAHKAGTSAVVYLRKDVSESRAARIGAFNAQIVRIAGTYDDAVLAAEAAALRGDGLLISDTSSDPNSTVANDVMAGYGLMAREIVTQFQDDVRDRPTHLFVQAGVGGLAAALVDGLQDLLRAPRKFLIIEPDTAACVARALEVGHAVRIDKNSPTSAALLACGLASASALRILQKHSVHSVLVPDAELNTAATGMRNAGGPHTTPSGAAGFAGLLHVAARPDFRAMHQLAPDSVILLIATEQA